MVRANQTVTDEIPIHKEQAQNTITRPYRIIAPFLTMGETLQPFILPWQNKNRSLILWGSWSSGIGINPKVL